MRGRLITFTQANPAAGVDINIAVPAAKRWRLIVFHARLQTSAVVAARRVLFVLTDPGGLEFFREGNEGGDQVFIGAGAGLDAGLQVAHVRPVPRALADVTAALLVRTWKPLGRTEGSHFTFGFGAALVELVGFIAHRSP